MALLHGRKGQGDSATLNFSLLENFLIVEYFIPLVQSLGVGI